MDCSWFLIEAYTFDHNAIFLLGEFYDSARLQKVTCNVNLRDCIFPMVPGVGSSCVFTF